MNLMAWWFVASCILGLAMGYVLGKTNPTGDDDDAQARRPAWDDVADLEAFLAQHPDNTGIRRATR
jgi:hypothetical protein